MEAQHLADDPHQFLHALEFVGGGEERLADRLRQISLEQQLIHHVLHVDERELPLGAAQLEHDALLHQLEEREVLVITRADDPRGAAAGDLELSRERERDLLCFDLRLAVPLLRREGVFLHARHSADRGAGGREGADEHQALGSRGDHRIGDVTRSFRVHAHELIATRRASNAREVKHGVYALERGHE